MEKLKIVTEFFDKLREDEDDTVYTEDRIIEVLTELDVCQYDVVEDVPTRVINDILTEITEGLCPRLNPNQEQEMLDFFEEISVKNKVELPIIAKSLRYLLRNDKTPKTALLIVDVQNDFISGALALHHTPAHQDGEEVVGVINGMLDEHDFNAVFYSFDWHPQNHCSYQTNVSMYPLHESSSLTAEDAKVFDKVVYDGEKVLEQVLWPVHCVQNSEGAELHPELKVADNSINIFKGMLPHVDSYSAVWDNGRLSRSDLLGHLFDKDITHVFTCGLATDFCVGMTALDVAEHGFDVLVVEDACRGVADETIAEMREKMLKAGCELIQSCDVGDKISSFE